MQCYRITLFLSISAELHFIHEYFNFKSFLDIECKFSVFQCGTLIIYAHQKNVLLEVKTFLYEVDFFTDVPMKKIRYIHINM